MKLFHCVVVMGAAMGGGCGGAEQTGNGRSKESGDASDATALLSPQQDASLAFFNCTAFSACVSTCLGPPEAPHSAQDCPQPQQFQCDGAACGCDPSAPRSPTDCPQTAQFVCSSFAPPCSCRCDLEAGIDPGACCGDAGFDGAGPCVNYSTFSQWSCQSYEPPVGCDCRRMVVAIL